MNPGMTLWKDDPLYPKPFSPVQRALKFSAVFGTTSDLSSMTMRPMGLPLAVMSKYTRGNLPASVDMALTVTMLQAPTWAVTEICIALLFLGSTQ